MPILQLRLETAITLRTNKPSYQFDTLDLRVDMKIF